MKRQQYCNEEEFDENIDAVHLMRIKEFMMTNQQLISDAMPQRPKCSISPINASTTEEDDSNSLLVQSSPTLVRPQPQLATAIQSPSLYIMPTFLNIQSTPHKPHQKRNFLLNKTNFHSISDLATSSSSSSSSSSFSPYNSSQSTSSVSFNDMSSYQHINQSIPQIVNYSTVSLEETNLFSNNNKENQFMASLPQPLDFLHPNDFVYCETKRKPRTQITRQHRQVLERVYASNKYPDSNEIEHLTHLLGFDENVIRIWFQNKRARSTKTKMTAHVKL